MSKTKVGDEFVLLADTKLRYIVIAVSGTIDSVLVHLKFAGKNTWFFAPEQKFITLPEGLLADYFQKLDLK